MTEIFNLQKQGIRYEFWIHGIRHIEYLPEYQKEKFQEWFLKGECLHRKIFPAVIYPDGSEYWVNGKRHREDGPAIISSDGYKAWYINDKRHRVDGPARIHSDGSEEYWVNDIKITEKQFKDKKALALMLIVG